MDEASSVNNTGQLVIDTLPVGAEVEIGEDTFSPTPVGINDMDEDSYDYSIKMEGYDIYFGQIDVHIGMISHIFVNLGTGEYREEYVNIGEKLTDFIPKEIEQESEHGMLVKHLDTMNRILDRNNDLLVDVANSLDLLRQYIGKSQGFNREEKYINSERIAITTTTSNKPGSPDIIADPNTTPPTPGYDRVEVAIVKNGDNSRSLLVINDGTTDLYVVVSSDGKTWSQGENIILVGDYTVFHNVYELRIRSPSLGNLIANTGGIYRYTEYDVSLSYSNITLTATSNRTAIATFNLSAPQAGALLPALAVPNQFSLIIKAHVNNTGLVYVADTVLNTQNAATRITLAAGDVVRYSVTNANVIAVAADSANQSVDISSEQ